MAIGGWVVVTVSSGSGVFEEASASGNKVLSVHRWVNWIAGFSGEFAEDVIKQYLPTPTSDSLVLDPFAGAGTALVEACRAGVNSVGFEINPFAALVSRVKMQALDMDMRGLREEAARYVEVMRRHERGDGANGAPRSRAPAGFRSRIRFFSERVEEKVLHTLDYIETVREAHRDVFRVALASVLVEFSNYTYEPSLSSRPGAGKPLVHDAPVGEIVGNKLRQIVADTATLQEQVGSRLLRPSWVVHNCSYFESPSRIGPGSVDLVVTSPPYMNNYHYVRNTRPQLYWIALATSAKELKRLEEENFGKFWQTVRGRAAIPLGFALPELEQQISDLRERNVGRGVYGGAGWANYATAYMNDLYRFGGLLAAQLRVGTGVAVIVLGNSVIQGMLMPVEQYMAEIGEMHGLKAEGTFSLRSRVGSSIVNTGARISGIGKHGLYDYAVVLRRAQG